MVMVLVLFCWFGFLPLGGRVDVYRWRVKMLGVMLALFLFSD